MSAEVKKEIALEIAHVLFIDIVGYSKLSINEQHAVVEELNQVVRTSEQFQRAESTGRLLKIATGDGMALVFYTSPEAPAQCAVEISRAVKEHPRLQLRMGIHSGPVSGVVDVNDRPKQPGNILLLGDLALVNMGLGDKAAALALAERAIAASPIEKDAIDGPAPIEFLARVAARMGEPDRALDALQKLLSIPYEGPLAENVPLTPALLRLDPMFDPLRNDPRFQKLAAAPASKAAELAPK